MVRRARLSCSSVSVASLGKPSTLGSEAMGGDAGDDAAHGARGRRVAGRVAAGRVGVACAEQDAGLELAEQLAQAHGLLVLELVGDAGLADGELAAADLDAGGEDLRQVGLARAVGEPRRGGVGTLELRRGDDEQGIAGGRVGPDGRAAVAADDADLGAAGLDDAEDFGRLADADEVAEANDVRVEDGDPSAAGERVEGVDGRAVGERRVLEPLVDHAAGGAAGVAEQVEQRRLGRGGDGDEVGDVLDVLGQVAAGGVGGFSGERHSENW